MRENLENKAAIVQQIENSIAINKALITQVDTIIGIADQLTEAFRRGNKVLLFGKGGKLRQIAEYVLSIPSTDTPRIQEGHITAGHIICYLVERSLFGTNQHISASSNSKQRKALPQIKRNLS